MAIRFRVAVLVAAGVACGGLALLLLAPDVSPRLVRVVSNTVQLLLPALVAVPCCVAAARASTRGRRWSWALLGAGCASWAIGQAIFAWDEVVAERQAFPSLADAGFLLAVPLLVAGVAMQPAGLLRMGRVRVVLDGAVVVTALLFAATGTFLAQIWEAGEGTAFERALLIAYPASDVLVVAVAVAIVARRPAGLRGPLGFVIAGVCSLAVADCAFAWLTSQGEHSDPITDVGWPIGFLLIGLAAHRAMLRGEREAGVRPTRAVEAWLPQVPVAMAAIVLATRAVNGDGIGSFLGVTGALLLVLVLVRQVLVQLENSELNRVLEGTVLELRQREDELEYRALHDHLTGLANRALFRDRLQHATTRRGAADVTVLFIDLDDFKTVNDTMGHDAGDRLLVLLAERLRACVRGGDTVARLGGDEFAVLLDDGDPDEGQDMGDRVLAALEVPFTVAGRELRVRASVGVVSATAGAVSAEQLLQDADLAMYAAKDGGGSRVKAFAPVMRREAVDRLDLIGDLDGALDRGEFVLHYQPVIRLGDGSIVGHEALLRWQHAERGLLRSTEFLAYAEETGLLVPIGWWALERACQQLVDRGEDARDQWVAVNVSVAQLEDPAIIDRIIDVLARTGLEPRRVVLEVTERALGEGPALVDTMRRLRALGLRLAMDDFGTGYSSLASLAGLPLDALKVDTSFVARLGSMEGEVLVQAVIDLARALGLRTTAEGVEEQWQLDRLIEIGCDDAQGHLLGRPAAMPAPAPLVRIPSTNRA